MSMKFTGVIQNGQLILSDVQRVLREQHLSMMKSGTLIEENLTKISPNKTHKQVKTIFGLVLTMIIQAFDDNGWDSSILLKTDKPTGVGVNKELLRQYLYSVCPLEEGKTLKNASIEDAMKVINDWRNYASSQWGVYIPDPNPNWREEKEKDGKRLQGKSVGLVQ